MQQKIVHINRQITNCTRCRLHQTRIHAVCGEGIIPSRIMVIAQAPGRKEDHEGRMLIGPSGQIFDQILGSLGINRHEVYLTNLLKCFLPRCRKPRQDEMNTCYIHYLKKEIALVKPEFIVTLGYHVTKYLFNQFELKQPNKISFQTTFGELFSSQNRKIIPLRHPATVVHNSIKLKQLINEYEILNTIQTLCPYFYQCIIPENYKNGLTPKNLLDKFCHGNWKQCKRYYSYSKGLQPGNSALPE
ncbi:MAG: uracil-DNA glycosylase [Bacteroidales bacterium]|nr:uracil-DNA glycosylase [Bacteroidales bacterium]